MQKQIDDSCRWVSVFVDKLLPSSIHRGLVAAIIFGIALCVRSIMGYFIEHFNHPTGWDAIFGAIGLILIFMYLRGHNLNQEKLKATQDAEAHKQAMNKIQQDWLKNGKNRKFKGPI